MNPAVKRRRSDTGRRLAGVVAGIVAPLLLAGFASTSAVAAGPAWSPSGAQREALAAGEVVVDARLDEQRQQGEVRAAVRIAAPPARVYAAMTDCRAALAFVPGLHRCAVIEAGAAGRWEIIEHEVDLGWWAPRVRYSFRAEYVPDRSVEFAHVAGDLRQNEGRWDLEPLDGGRHTLVTYRVRLVPAAPVPGWLVRRSLRTRLPALLTALRDHAQAPPP